MAKSSKGKGKASKVQPPSAEAKVPVENNIKEEIKEDIKPVGNNGKNIIDLIRSKISVYTIALIAILAIMLYIRIVLPYDTVFTDWAGNYVNFAQDDAVYQMRLVHNTVENFPQRLFYDPFTHFPYGSTIHFGPLFTLMIAFSSIVIGLGSPSAALVDTIGAYFPAVLGALCAIPTYYICKKLFSKGSGLIAALTLAFLPGQFLGRSMLGFTDHHIAEVLFATTAIMFLVYALDAAKKHGLSFEMLKNRDYKALKKPLLYAALTGIALGAYLLVWPGMLLFGFILFVYFIVQMVVDHVKGKDTDYLVIIAALTYLIPALMVLPYSVIDFSFQLLYYSMTQPVIMFMGFFGILVSYAVSKALNKNKVEKFMFPAVLGGLAIIGMLLIFIINQNLYGLIIAGFNVFTPQGGMLTVQEVRPTYLSAANQLTFTPFWYLFYLTFPISVIALVMLLYEVYKHYRPSEILFLVWNIIMVWALFSQNRFAYYFAINAALLTGYFAYKMFKLFSMDKLKESLEKKVKTLDDLPVFISKNLKIGQVLLVLTLLLIAIFPATPLANSMTIEMAKYGPGMGYEWFDTLQWMKQHTPDPQSDGFKYNTGIYQAPDKETDRYNYPASAYGVMSWWDYGHIITYVAERIPNANPFQAGILEENKTYGSSKFFIAQTEEEGVKNLNSMGSRYVVIDNEMATGKFYAIQKWSNDTDGWYNVVNLPINEAANKQFQIYTDSAKFYNSMMNRLYYQDCNAMSNFRLVYDSTGDYVLTFKYADITTGQINENAQMRKGNYTEAYELYKQAIMPAFVNEQGTAFVYDAKPPAKWVKVFEKVKGATITGSAPDNTTVNLTLTLKSNSGREFNYTQVVKSENGVYKFVVPYPTEAMKGNGYSYDVIAVTKYNIEYGGIKKSVDVSEDAVMSGGTVQVTA
jgi:dolichyl-diphosphooligosaccharide--protein glycosyltransferase